jgi:hypothetical protein
MLIHHPTIKQRVIASHLASHASSTSHMTCALQNETNLAINQMEVSYSGMESQGGSHTIPIERKRSTFCHAGLA